MRPFATAAALLVVVLFFATDGMSADKTGFVVIERTDPPAYLVVTRFPEKDRETVRAKKQTGVKFEMIDWTRFKSDPNRYIGRVIVKNEYPESGLSKGLVALLDNNPMTPFGVTWTGGLAVTYKDYEHTKRLYMMYRDRPGDYERNKVSNDRKRDPINPENHF
jgi:hypothetical protein